jgi:hypothetical protein
VGTRMLVSDILANNVMKLANEERERTGESSELQVAAIKLAVFHLNLRDQALKMEEVIHNMTKALEKKGL